MALLLPVIVALLALLWVSAFHMLARRLRWLPAVRASHRPVVAAGRASSLRPLASTRMAVQMAVALAMAFVVGYVFFAERWAWIVLTAYIVNSGNQGRLDVAYKSLLRVLGAGAGTLVALAFAVHAGSHDSTIVVLMLTAVFLGIWLRPLGYAWWALFVTLALALLQGFEGGGARQILSLRLEEIAIGAVIGVAAAWLVWPVRSTGVLRLRLAEALATLSEALDPATAQRRPDGFVAALGRLESIAPAFRAARRLGGRLLAVQPADWIDAMLACRASAIALIEDGATPAEVRQAVGAARKAMREPAHIQPALQQLRQALTAPNADRPR
jgi:Predicted membrane protein